MQTPFCIRLRDVHLSQATLTVRLSALRLELRSKAHAEALNPSPVLGYRVYTSLEQYRNPCIRPPTPQF